jgi:long-subunit acyl-CoA synthetase (AMP-forming)
LVHAIHRFNGIASPINAVSSPTELEYQLRKTEARALVTCVPLLETALAAAKEIALPHDRIFVMDVPGSGKGNGAPFTTLEDLVAEGRKLPGLEAQVFAKGQGARQVAFLCFSSGTSGLPVSRAMLSFSLLPLRSSLALRSFFPFFSPCLATLRV